MNQLPVLEINNIGKAYRSYRNNFMRFASWFGIKTKAVQETWTLKNINFKLMPGEAVGIIGQNGAGKSTLLKIITGTLQHSTGNVVVRGKIAAILELGMGFHPDLTGRQNAYHAAGLMGYSKAEVDAVIADIEAFAEIGEYFDQPVRLYSSGMHVRVAFAVATAYRPEILIVDEALSVGDIYFQYKSFDRIKQFREAGTSLLFVSHDKASILALCDRAVLLEKGVIIKDAFPEEVTDYYNALIAKNSESKEILQEKTTHGRVVTISGSRVSRVLDIGLYDSLGNKLDVVDVGQTVTLRVIISSSEFVPELVFGFMIKDKLGQVMFGLNTKDYDRSYESRVGSNIIISIEMKLALGVGGYSISTALARGRTHLEGNLEWKDCALIFEVVNLSKRYFVGNCWLESSVKVD